MPLAVDFKAWQAELNKGLIRPVDYIFLVILKYLESRAPGQWWMKKSTSTIHRDQGPSLSRLSLELQTLKCQGLVDFLTNYQIKKLPGGVAEALLHWHQHPQDLCYLEDPPSPEQLLALQAQGLRVVTFSVDKAVAGRAVDGRRDSFEFLLHDLVHAHLFFSAHHQEQKQFFTALQDTWRSLPQSLWKNPRARQGLDYVMADMNSNYPHLYESLRAALIEAYKLSDDGLENQRLSSEHEAILESWLQKFKQRFSEGRHVSEQGAQ